MGDERMRGRAWRGLEMALFAVVFVAGGALASIAAIGESRVEARAPARAPVPGPIAAPTPGGLVFTPEILPGVPEEVPAPAGDFVQVANARADIAPSGCSARITFLWEIDPSTAPPGRLVAVIDVDGPAKAGEYRKRVVGDEVRLELDVPVTKASEWTADLVSVGGLDVFPTPLPVSFTDAFC